MRRFVLLVLTGVALTLVPAAPAAAAVAGAGASCVSASAATYRHTFGGASGTATVTAVRPLCSGQSRSFALVSYTAGPAGLFIYDIRRASVSAGRPSVSLEVTVPSCSTHVYALTGTDIVNETTTDAPAYGPTVLGSSASRSTGPAAMYAADGAACSPAPQVTFTNACNGTFRATVTNAPSASVATVLLTTDGLLRVAPGRSRTLPAAAGSTLTFRASNRTTYVGTWRTPSAPCTSAASSAAAPGSPESSLAGPSSVAAASPVPSASASTSTEAAAGSWYTPEPSALDAKNTAAPAKRGMSTGSILAIALGLLLMAAGGLILTKLIRANRQPA